ncbi:flagellar biosynthesis regulator FlaF [Hyphomonas pacifica]|uniref:Uncharacterized protein n=1 Tax=Hyphomonas pacifica TaxID=1280941 RepID=A0A062U397_9PROT|nr:flagellar biosynthesis regulator FlaF [Hyphomonas pacifica]KCZ52188.1 hypothetical protein HY2_09230 [Hyphomonas pacifica]RAN35042.1 hypothetical protein HY3_09360 [Hyphomonas pacifica]RAN37503.1 hypothetical protein HY11_08435 [Hyphomonas pacifica]
MQQLAYKAYGEVTNRTASDEQIEYALFQEITQALKAVAQTDRPSPVVWVDAIDRNLQLWQLISTDVMSEANQLDPSLKANLITLAESVRMISYHVLSRKADVSELVEINEIIMEGLAGQTRAVEDMAVL